MKPTAEQGFTFMEILVSLVLLSVLTVVLWSGFRGAQSLIGRVSAQASLTARIIQLDEYLRRKALAVRIPFWEGAVDVEQGEGALAVPYLEGDAEDYLTLENKRRLLLIGSRKDGGVSAFGPFKEVAFAVQENEQGKPWGLKVEVEAGESDRIVILAPFGAIPF